MSGGVQAAIGKGRRAGSLAVDCGPAISARIRPSISSIHPPFLAAAKVLAHAASTSTPVIS